MFNTNSSNQIDPVKNRPFKEEIINDNNNRCAPAAITGENKRKRSLTKRKEVEAVMAVIEEEIVAEETAAVEIKK
jgi:hypothetical protein